MGVYSRGLPLPAIPSVTVRCASPDNIPPILNTFQLILTGNSLAFSVNASDNSGRWGGFYVFIYKEDTLKRTVTLSVPGGCCSETDVEIYDICPCQPGPPFYNGVKKTAQIHHDFNDGTYTVRLVVVDMIGNKATFDVNELSDRGFISSFDINFNPDPDTTPPFLINFRELSHEYTGSQMYAEFNVTLVEGESWSVYVSYVPASGYATVVNYILSPIRIIYDDGADANVIVPISITPSQLHNGLWVPIITVYDGNGNSEVFTGSSIPSPDPIGIYITTASNDIIPPMCTNVTMTPSVVDTSTSSVLINITATCADSSGLYNSGAIWVRDDTTGYEWWLTPDENWKETIILPRFYPPTTLSVIGFVVGDKVHNVALYGTCSRSYQSALEMEGIAGMPNTDFCGTGAGLSLRLPSITYFVVLFLILIICC